MIDLHSHSTFSDGELSPQQLLELARSRGIRALALTDHDTTSGLAPFTGAACTGVEPIPGVELSVMLGSDTLHIVGLFLASRRSELEVLLETIRTSRAERNRRIVRRLQHLGCRIRHEDLERASPDGVIGRPHIAQALVREGKCATMREAFATYLGAHGKAYVKRFRPSAEKAIAAVRNAGGIAVWAHPLGGRSMPEDALRARMETLRQHGVDAVESHYSDHSPEQRRLVNHLARELNLLVSGGSDFHGAQMPGIELGTGRGDLDVPDDILPPLRQRARQRAQTAA